MSNAKVLVILGYSRVGKDTAAKELLKLAVNPLVNTKFSKPMKVVLEYLYSLPPGALNRDYYRNLEVPSMTDGTTYLDLMVKSFDVFRGLDKNIMLHLTGPDIRLDLDYHKSVMLTDLRTHEEADLVARLASRNPVYLLRIHRPGVTPKESDRYVDELESYLAPHCQRRTAIWNDQELTKFQKLLGVYAQTIKL